MLTNNPLRLRQFFATVSMPCPYLPMRTEQKLVIELRAADRVGLHTELARAGFRRSHHLAYRPACRACNACVPVRINTARFKPTRSLKRTWRNFQHLTASYHLPVADDEHFDLFHRYVTTRHRESEMALMEHEDFASMLEESPVDTQVMSLRDEDGTLIAACLCDRLNDGISAVYSYFDPQAKGSLGSHIIMRLVLAMAAAGKPNVYLGYWIDGSDTMAYKSRFPGVEGLIGGTWGPLQADPLQADPLQADPLQADNASAS